MVTSWTNESRLSNQVKTTYEGDDGDTTTYIAYDESYQEYDGLRAVSWTNESKEGSL